MNSAPWWFVLVTALVTGGFTLAGVWLTVRSTLRRHREELVHDRLLEREKQLYDRRIGLYAELNAAIDTIMTGLQACQRYWRETDGAPLPWDAVDSLTPALTRVRALFHQVNVVSGLEVRALARQFIGEVDHILDDIGEAGDSPCAWSDGEATFAANYLIWEMRIETGTASRDDDDEAEMRELY